MPKIQVKKPSKTANNITPAARGALGRLKKNHGITQARAVERGVLLLENQLKKGVVL